MARFIDEAPMMELFFSLLTIAFFALASFFLRACARLK